MGIELYVVSKERLHVSVGRLEDGPRLEAGLEANSEALVSLGDPSTSHLWPQIFLPRNLEDSKS